jgi:hypothetical protein
MDSAQVGRRDDVDLYARTYKTPNADHRAVVRV